MSPVSRSVQKESCMLGHQGTFIKHWLTHLVHEQGSQELTVKEESSDVLLPDYTDLPIVYIDGIKIGTEHSCMYTCSKSCWVILRPFVKGIAELDNYFGHLHTFRHDFPSKSSIVWNMEECSMSEKCKHTGQFWFCIPTHFNRPFLRLLSDEFGLYHGNTQVLCSVGEGTFNPEKLPLHALSPWLLCVVHHGEDDLGSLLCGATTAAPWPHDTREFSAIGNISSPVIKSTNPLFTSHTKCSHWNNASQHRGGTGISHSGPTASYAEPQSLTQKEMVVEIEIHEMDIKLLKTEVESDFADQGISIGNSNSIFLNQEKKPETARSHQLCIFIEKYCSFMLGLGFQSYGREPFIVVECPVCPRVYKGTSDRLLHLINHVEKRHKYKCEELLGSIEITYDRLLQCMKRRLGKSGVGFNDLTGSKIAP